jgi:2,3-bisphosphoglycerate-independent phosphoglycerate mutase
MKYLLLLGDGMADFPLDELGGKTPLQAAKTPNMDRLAQGGEIGLVKTIPDGFMPGSDVANLSVLGYDPSKYFTGRAPLEAASMGIDLDASDVAFRCNLVTIEDSTMADFSAGHISTREASELIQEINKGLSNDQISFYPGVSYRHLMVWKNGKEGASCTPPHDISGLPIKDYLPVREGAEFLKDLMIHSQNLLPKHPVNQERVRQGKHPANSIWLWGQGRRPSMPTFQEKFGLTGSVIAAVDLVKGLGIYAGLSPVHVPGATGYFDTNYRGKAQASLESLQGRDFVYLHVESPDEAGHIGDIQEKIRAIENFDEKVVGPILEGLKEFDAFRVLLLPDHPTPISTRTHSSEMCPFVIYDSRHVRESGQVYDEITAGKSGLVVKTGHEIMDRLIKEEQ